MDLVAIKLWASMMLVALFLFIWLVSLCSCSRQCNCASWETCVEWQGELECRAECGEDCSCCGVSLEDESRSYCMTEPECASWSGWGGAGW